jgi:hexosaminidase
MSSGKARAVHTVLAFVLALSTAHGQVIPLPAQSLRGDGFFTISTATVITVPRADPEALAAARYLASLWRRTNALRLPVSLVGGDAGPQKVGGSVIRFQREKNLGAEAYKIEVKAHRITVAANTSAGLFYGAISLWQLLPPRHSARQIPAQSIADSPRYGWRGLMLDSVRHFQPPAFIHSMIDWMAWHKLNVLHWHLTDDQGWRLQIRKYPRLTSVGAWRGSYGGFYTQRQVRELVAFAASRHVQIVPEIEMPGHAQAAIAAYPELGVGDKPLAVSPNWGVHTHLFNLEPQTFRFLEDVLAEVMQLFPSVYVHVGGDEAVKDEWNSSPRVQAQANELGIKDGDALQAYFTQRIGHYLNDHGRRLVGWDEILTPGLPTNAIVMSWHGVSGAHDAAVAGNDAILAPEPALYFDRRQSTLASEPPGRLQLAALKDVFRFDPYDSKLTSAQQQHVLGVQANLWTEHIQTDRRVEWMALPRAAALAETAWSTRKADWPDFLARLVPMFARYRAYDLGYADSAFGIDPVIAPSPSGFRVTLSNTADLTGTTLATIRYTLDGSVPSAQSAAYAAPLLLPLDTLVRAATFVGAEQASRIWARRLDATAARRDSHDLELCSNRIGLLLEPAGAAGGGANPLAVDIMNPCWIDRGVDMSVEKQITTAVAPLAFNYELGADLASISIGHTQTAAGELEIHADSCSAPPIATLPLAAAGSSGVTLLPAQKLPILAGRHDLCFRFARPRLDPMWGLAWIEIRE